MDDLDFLSIRPRIEENVAKDTCSEGEEQCDGDGLSAAKQRVAAVHYQNIWTDASVRRGFINQTKMI